MVVGAAVLIGSPGAADRAYEQKIAAQELVMDGIVREVERSARTLDTRAVIAQTSRIEDQTALVRVWQKERAEQKTNGRIFGGVLLLVGAGLAIYARSFQRK
jgi:hypothetical protein